MVVSLARGAVHDWPGWWIRRGPLELGLVPEIGGRLMSLRWHGVELSFVHPDHAGRAVSVGTEPDVAARKRAMGFVHWGGDKTWLAPQERWNDAMPFLDLDGGAYALDVERDGPDGVRVTMTSPVCRESGARIVRTLAVPAGTGDFTVTHRLENASPAPITWGLWDVHQVRGPGMAYVPRRTGSAYRDGVRSYPAEGDSEGARPEVVRLMDGVAAIDCRRPRWFKYGVDATEGWALGIVETPHGLVGYRKEVPVVVEARYAHGAVVEVYNAPGHAYFELEVHGPLVTLAPGEDAVLVERRSVFDVDAWPEREADVHALVST